MQDQVGDERLLEGRCEPLHELRRKPPNEPDGVGHEVALPVVLERAGRGIERLEQAIVDGGIGAGERVQERRFSDVRVAGESDGRSGRAHALLASRRALALKRAQAPLEERDTRASESAVGLELTLARPARPDTAAQALEVLPHASHAREVVFELRELDLELAFGRPRVLSEDVEDQLRAVDHARAELVLERALLRRAELVVGDEDLRRRAGVRRLELAELALPDERPRIRMTAVLHDLSYRCGTRGTCELTELRELVAGRALRIHADEERPLRLRPGRGIGLARSHRGIMPRYAPAVTALADRLAARTLELVDIPSQSGNETAIREHLLELVPPRLRGRVRG